MTSGLSLPVALPVVLLLLVAVLGLAAAGVFGERRHSWSSWALLALAEVTACSVAFAFHEGGSLPSPLPGFRFDVPSLAMGAVLGLIGFAVHRFSLSYLRGEPNQHRFLKAIHRTIFFVYLFVFSTHLVVIGLAWLGMSFGMHALLRHYDERPAARRAARKKFLLSRFADVAFWTAVVLVARSGASLDLANWTEESLPGDAGIVAALFVVAVVLKSAQFPFHTWLPETMEAPTPVSALMHAGVVNAGAFLLLRSSALLSAAPFALDVLLIAGTLSAALGCLGGVSQTTVKGRLAWSTIAQMGFLCVEIGLGLYHAALLHLLGHALYKAHAFLRSGTLEGSAERALSEPRGSDSLQDSLPLVAIGGCALGIVFLRLLERPHELSESVILLIGFAASIDVSRRSGRSLLGRAFLAVGLFVALTFTQEFAAKTLSVWFAASPDLLSRGPVALGCAALLLFSALAVTVWSAGVRRLRDSEWGFALQVHAVNGFYIGAFTNRLYEALTSSPSPESHRA